MTRNREIRKVGNSWYIKLNPIDILDFKLKEKDLIDIEDLVTHNVRNKKYSKRKTKGK